MLSRQLVSYLIVGVLSAGVDVGLMQTLLLLGYSSTLAVTTAFLLTLVFNYFCQKKFTFRASHSTQSAFKYLCIVAVNYGITLGFVYAGVLLVNSAILGKLASLPIISLVGFIASRHWIFHSSSTT